MNQSAESRLRMLHCCDLEEGELRLGMQGKAGLNALSLEGSGFGDTAHNALHAARHGTQGERGPKL